MGSHVRGDDTLENKGVGWGRFSNITVPGLPNTKCARTGWVGLGGLAPRALRTYRAYLRLTCVIERSLDLTQSPSILRSNLSHDLGLSECHPLFEIGKFETGSHEPCLGPGATVITNILGPKNMSYQRHWAR